MIRHDHRHTRFNVLACLHVVDETLVRLSRHLARCGTNCPRVIKADITRRIDGCLDERLRLMRLRDALRRTNDR